MTFLQLKSEFKKMFTFPDHAGKYYWLYGAWESWNIRQAKKFSELEKKNDVFIDVGANLGAYTLNLSDHFRKIVSFEPLPVASHILRANVMINNIKNCNIVDKAVGNFNGKAVLNLDPKDTGKSSLIKKENHLGEYEVDIVTLDSYFSNFRDISMIKIDVEGSELEVLEGAKLILNKQHPIIQFELDNINNNDSASKILKLLKSFGYSRFYQLKNNKWTRLKKRFLIHETKIQKLKVKSNTFYQAIWALK